MHIVVGGAIDCGVHGRQVDRTLVETNAEDLSRQFGCSMQADPSKRVVIPPESLFQPMDDEAVVLSIATEHYYGLNETAKRVWELLAEHGDPEKVVVQMLTEFDVVEGTLRNDVARLVEELHQAQLIRIEK